MVPVALAVERADLYTTVDEADGVNLDQWSGSGFTVNRRQNNYLISSDPETTGLRGARPPAGVGGTVELLRRRPRP